MFLIDVLLNRLALQRIGPIAVLVVSLAAGDGLEGVATSSVQAADHQSFLERHCLDCHGAAEEGDRRLDNLSQEFSDPQVEQLRIGRSILDAVADRAASLQRRLGPSDRSRLDQYFTAVREVERRLVVAEQWERRPKPKVDVPPPKDGEYLLEKLGAMHDLIRLALATDSTRLVTVLIRLDGFGADVPGVSSESHNLSHHVGREDKLAQLKTLEIAQLRELVRLLGSLRETQDGEQTLLDRTTVLYGSNLGNGNNHDTKNLPILLAGGGFRHGQHLAFDKTRNYPLPNLFVSMLQRLGLEVDRFASSNGTMRGLEMS